MIRSLLVANRGEIACRIFRTCRELGIATVAVYADPDADALHVREADTAVRLPGEAPADTYLRADLIVGAALAAGADAVHPGYGFLAESAEFAREVAGAGLVWAGPPPAAIEAMASKTRAKELMGSAPPAEVTEADLPVLVKAVAGGGGRGMRIVRALAELPGALEAAGAEAEAAFGDGAVFVEPYVEGGRHVEVQLLCDRRGTVWTLGTRDCSLQRRHQKVIEEAPAPGLGPELTASLYESSAAVARAVGYEGAGTVEFLIAPDGRACFLEMNTRLQVEHPVTEAVFGIDLVAWQIRIAEGEPLPAEPPAAHGHAVEARLYAEDPAHDWAPQTGTIHRLSVPSTPGPPGTPQAPGPPAPPETPRLRVDTGYADGDTITIHYDAMLAKVVAHAPTRAQALRALAGALERARVHGPATNRELLVRSLNHPEFVAGGADTGFYERHRAELAAPAPDPHAPLAAALADACGRSRFGGWRNLPSQPQVKRYRTDEDGAEHEVRYHWTREGFEAEGVRVLKVARDLVVLEAAGVRRTYDVSTYEERRALRTPGAPPTQVPVPPPYEEALTTRVYVGNTPLTPLPRHPGRAPAPPEPGSLLAPMPGTVVRLAEGLAEGDRVEGGQPLLWLEAMKMEHRVTAPAAGTLTALHAAPGRRVETGALLAVVTAHDAPAAPPTAPPHHSTENTGTENTGTENTGTENTGAKNTGTPTTSTTGTTHPTHREATP